MNTYVHAGDRGDVVSSLPTIRYTGGGVLYLQAATYTREMLTPDKWCGLDTLLREQPYITDVLEWRNQRCTYNLNDWRVLHMRAMRSGHMKNKNLADWHLEHFGIPVSERDRAWLQVKEPIKAARVVFNRTGPGREAKFTYQNNLFPWHRVWSKYRDDAVFIGTALEHEVFRQTCGDIPHFKTRDLHEAARVIAGADIFVGNQSVCGWLASSLFKTTVLEVWTTGPNSSFNRPNFYNGYDHNVFLPELP